MDINIPTFLSFSCESSLWEKCKFFQGTGLSKSGREKSWDLNQRQSGGSKTKWENDREVSKMEDLPGVSSREQRNTAYFATGTRKQNQKNRKGICPIKSISTQEKFPRTENFPKMSLLKVENFQLQKDFFPTENLCRPITCYKIFLSGDGL
jgi:hypothetical protein